MPLSKAKKKWRDDVPLRYETLRRKQTSKNLKFLDVLDISKILN